VAFPRRLERPAMDKQQNGKKAFDVSYILWNNKTRSKLENMAGAKTVFYVEILTPESPKNREWVTVIRYMMKGENLKRVIALILSFLLFATFVGCQSNVGKLGKSLIKVIENNYSTGNKNNIIIKDITDFVWDKMVIYEYGSPKAEISALLGIEFDGDIDETSGIIFVNETKIVYMEKIYNYRPDERPKKFTYILANTYNSPGHPRLFTPDDAIFIGNRFESGGAFCYYIIPLDSN